jgi:hypothetical protein
LADWIMSEWQLLCIPMRTLSFFFPWQCALLHNERHPLAFLIALPSIDLLVVCTYIRSTACVTRINYSLEICQRLLTFLSIQLLRQ